MIRSIVVQPESVTWEDWGLRVGADRGEPRVRGVIIQPATELLPEVGLWECTPGSWPIVDRANTETVYALSGRAEIEDASGQLRQVGPGDVLVLPRGWSGRWIIIEKFCKVYVLSKAG